MPGRAYANTFQLIAENGDLSAVLTTSEIERDMFHGLNPYMIFNLSELEHEKHHLPAYLTEKFGPLGNPDKHPDINLLNEAIGAIKETRLEIAAKLLPNLLQDRAVEAQIEQGEHPSRNMLDQFLSDRASKPAPQPPQQG